MEVVADTEQGVGRDKSYCCEHGGADVEMDGAAVGEVVMVDCEIARGGRPEVGCQEEDAVAYADERDKGDEDAPEQSG